MLDDGYGLERRAPANGHSLKSGKIGSNRRFEAKKLLFRELKSPLYRLNEPIL